jgi:outer membrane protein assembly factor BamB
MDSRPVSDRPLRLWPGVLFAAVIVFTRFVAPLIFPDTLIVAIITGLVGTVAIVVWWSFFSRAPRSERMGALVVIAVAVLAVRPLLHRSIATGMMGNMFYVYALPAFLGPAFVAWAVLARRWSSVARWVSMAVAVLLGVGVWTLMRTDGVLGGAGAQLQWRWTKTSEERLLAQEDTRLPPVPPPTPPTTTEKPVEAPAPAATRDEATSTGKPGEPAVEKKTGVTPAAPAPVDTTPVEWPGFRGPERNGIVRDVRIETDWSKTPPVELWRRRIGPGWSSFAVHGDVLYTQEQRGGDELVSAYKVTTGQPVWRHRDSVRFWESNGGAGPRATPTLSGGRVYTFGATGILNALNERDGSVIWSHNAAADAGMKVPMWGFASSPLVKDDLVIVAAGGTLVAYDRGSGRQRWVGPHGTGSYSSPHPVTIDGVDQILLLNGAGAESLSPPDGKVLWKHDWDGTAIVQPAVIAGGDVLINSIAATGGLGVRRVAVTHSASGWNVEERWTSTGLKPYFNDFVLHKGHAYGFDGSILSCIGLDDGARKWKGGRYGNGQLILLPEQDLLLVLSEEGELALVGATPDGFNEIARVPVLNGKTWNHPVLVGHTLLVRNGDEMAAFRIPPP